ncbi:TerC family protein [Brevibacillus composti]|uniref:TerC family protein n=1 Tax=Brevibacillus composti TaxID=2796470 RepID=A0A7T5EN74_9BACL|nr:TerC family protein [Brevibacillus composti]QQE75667.1 TerC family protein [Brevibacillus composti]QUO42693.1 TerC family protein [Brevibacillus composti]
MFDPEFFSALLLIITINIVLSGDNAVVIAIACRKLTPAHRKKAIFWATGLAIIVRIIATALAVYLLQIPYLYLVGGLILIWISYKLLLEDENEGEIHASDNLVQAVRTIVIADIMMGLDNVLAIAGAAGGDLMLIILGLLISIPIMVFGSQLILKAMERFPWLVYLGSGVLAWAAAKMIFEEKAIAPWMAGRDYVEAVAKIAIVAAVLLLGYLQRKRNAKLA